MNRMLFNEKTVVVQAKLRLETLGRFTSQLLKEVSQVFTISSAPDLVEDRSKTFEQLKEWKESFATIEKSRLCQIISQERIGIYI